MFFSKKGWESISFGFKLKTFTPFCHSSVVISKSQYMTTAKNDVYAMNVEEIKLIHNLPHRGSSSFFGRFVF